MRVRWATWLEGAVLVAEIMLIAFFSVPVWSSRVDVLPPEHQSTVVRVVAEQFAWNVHYPGADGIFGPTDISLVLPDNSLGLDRTTRPAATTSAFTSAA
jgi:cytochrome c oxidase subunit 2